MNIGPMDHYSRMLDALQDVWAGYADKLDAGTAKKVGDVLHEVMNCQWCGQRHSSELGTPCPPKSCGAEQR